MRWFFRTNFRSFYLLNATQFLGALNDNIFKLLVIYLLINLKGPDFANSILALAGAIFVIPFLLFSSGAGVLADKISKRTVIVAAKILELLVMIFGSFAVYLQWEFGAYTALFFMAAQSALFGPSKYGIIPELVEQKMISKANGSMTSFTYLAIILGTFLASFITDISNKNFLLESFVCIAIAILGLLTSLGISKTAAQRSPKKINPFFLYEIYQTLKTSWKIPHLLTAIFGSAFFLFIGAFTQLNIIPFAMQSLHLSEVGGGYLFLATAVGIAFGALLAGQLSKDKIEPGISCFAGFFISFFFFMLWFFASSLTCVIISLGFLGIVGGNFLIPFDSFIQMNSPDVKRGQVIAASNFFSFVGVLSSAFWLYFVNEDLGFSAASSFALMGLLMLLASLIITARMSSLFFPFFIQKILKRFRKLKLASSLPSPTSIIILQSNSWWDAILLFSCFHKLILLLPKRRTLHFPWLNNMVDSMWIIPEKFPTEAETHAFFKQMQKLQQQNKTLCLFLHKNPNSTQIIAGYQKAFGRFHYKTIMVHGVKERFAKRFLFFKFYQTQITITFIPK